MQSKRLAFTLLEVVAAIGLVASLLVAVLVAYDRLAKQTLRGRLRLEAIAAAEQLLSDWSMTQPMTLPAAEGTVAGNQQLKWRLVSRSQEGLDPWGVQVATLKVYDGAPDDQKQALATLEFLTTALVPGGRAP